MTELYKKNGAVFVPVGITLEEVEDLKDDNKVMADNYSKMEQKFYDNFTKAKEIIKDYMIIVKGAGTTVCSVPEENRTIYVLKLNKEAEQFLNGEVEKTIESSVDHIIGQSKKETDLNPDYFLGGW